MTVRRLRTRAPYSGEDNPVLSFREVGVDVDTGEFREGDGTTAWDDLPAVPGRDTDLHNDWSNHSDGVPTKVDTEQAIVSSYATNVGNTLTVSSGKLTNPYSGAGAGYVTAPVRDGASILYQEGEFEFGSGSTNGTVLAMSAWDRSFPAGAVSGTAKAAAHFIVTPTYFSFQTYDSTNGNARDLATATSYTIAVDTPKTVAYALDPANNRAVVLCPDGRVRVFYDTARSLISSLTVPYAQQEIIYAASTDKRGYWRKWRASTLTGKNDDDYAAKWHWLIGQAPKLHACALGSNYTLTSTTDVQKLFNSSTNGRVTLSVGTYRFRTMYSLTSMSGTSGNSAFSLAGTATIANLLMFANGYDGAAGTATAMTGSMGGSPIALPASQHTAGTATNQQSYIEGCFRVTTAGTVIPSIALVTAASAVVFAGSFFECWEIGSETLGTIGQWD